MSAGTNAEATPRFVRLARIVFVAAAAFAFVMAVSPHPPKIPGEPPDKILHILAFATLGALAAYAYHRVSIGRLLVGLTLLGALIEAIQAIPALNRDSELADLVADVVAAWAALVVTRWALPRVRVWRGR